MVAFIFVRVASVIWLAAATTRISISFHVLCLPLLDFYLISIRSHCWYCYWCIRLLLLFGILISIQWDQKIHIDFHRQSGIFIYFPVLIPFSVDLSCSHALPVSYFQPSALTIRRERKKSAHTNERTQCDRGERKIKDEPNCSENQHHWTGNNNNHF